MTLACVLVLQATGSTWLEACLVTPQEVPTIQKNSSPYRRKNSPPSGPHVYMKEMMGNAQDGFDSKCSSVITQFLTPSWQDVPLPGLPLSQLRDSTLPMQTFLGAVTRSDLKKNHHPLLFFSIKSPHLRNFPCQYPFLVVLVALCIHRSTWAHQSLSQPRWHKQSWEAALRPTKSCLDCRLGAAHSQRS